MYPHLFVWYKYSLLFYNRKAPENLGQLAQIFAWYAPRKKCTFLKIVNVLLNNRICIIGVFYRNVQSSQKTFFCGLRLVITGYKPSEKNYSFFRGKNSI